MKHFQHPVAPEVVVEGDEQRELLLLPAGWVEVSTEPTGTTAK